MDPWKNVLRSLEPAYDELKYFMEKGPRVIPELDHIRTGWRITLKEKFNRSIDYNVIEFDNLDSSVEWTCKQLEDWPDVNRTAWDMWLFKNKSDAEKFMTMFYLSWDK